MPYEWSPPQTQNPPPFWQVTLWPHRSLSPQGFTIFIATTCGMLLLPLLAVLGTPILWGLLPFLAGAVALMWYFLQRSNRDAQLREDLTLRADELTLIRQNPRKPPQSWTANPYWVQVTLHDTLGPVPNYLTLTGAGREVELGAFLSAEERLTLYRDLSDRLRQLDMNLH